VTVSPPDKRRRREVQTAAARDTSIDFRPYLR
jgi:hypothetical protein